LHISVTEQNIEQNIGQNTKQKIKQKNNTKDNTKHKFKNCCHPGTKTPGIWQQFSVLKENI
jgi:hypothetical protein